MSGAAARSLTSTRINPRRSAHISRSVRRHDGSSASGGAATGAGRRSSRASGSASIDAMAASSFPATPAVST